MEMSGVLYRKCSGIHPLSHFQDWEPLGKLFVEKIGSTTKMMLFSLFSEKDTYLSRNSRLYS